MFGFFSFFVSDMITQYSSGLLVTAINNYKVISADSNETAMPAGGASFAPA